MSDLRFCPHCGGDPVPPRTRAWHYRAPGIIAHADPVKEEEERAYRQNGWVLLCPGILLIPPWLLGVDILMDELTCDGGPDPLFVGAFVTASAVLALVFVSSILAFQARRPGTQVMAALFVVVILNAWHIVAWVFTVGLFSLLVALWARGGTSRSRSDPAYLPLMSGLAVLSFVMCLLFLLTAPMGPF